MKKVTVLISFAILCLSLNSLFAQGMAIGAKVSSLGLGVELKKGFSSTVGARVGFNYFTYTYDGTGGNVDYDYDLNLSSVTALLDFHPFGGSFRLSGGVIFNSNEIKANAVAQATYTIGDQVYTATDLGTLEGTIDFNKVSPYFSLGWDTSAGKSKGFGFIAELGVVMQGSPNVDLVASGPIATNAIFKDNLLKEEEKLESDVESFKYYPVAVIGIIYKF